ncbi:MAG TPA: caspase family protein [Chthonomonadales bacterium]|nr:caspase family protein [Chthonomonadales bacterium]
MELDKAVPLVFSQAFESVEVVRDKTNVTDQYDLLIEVAMPQLIIEGHCGGAVAAALLFGVAGAALSKQSVEAQVSLSATATDRNGQVLLTDTYRSGTHTKTFGGMEEPPPHVGEVVGEALADVLQQLARSVAASPKVRTHARTFQGKVSHQAQAGDFSAVLASDVDEPPKIHAVTSRNRHAVLIGIEQYRQQLPKVDFGAHDAKVMREYLTKILGYPDENVALLVNEQATRTDVEKYLERWLPNRVEKDSTVFIYYSGHGAPAPQTNEGYLVPYDGDPTFIDVTGYPLKRLYEQLARLPAKEVIVVLDSCFSGAGGRSVLAKGMRPVVISAENPVLATGNTVILTASSGAQISSTYSQKAHGLLTYFVLKGLHGEADQNQDGAIDLVELHAYVKPRVEGVSRREFNNQQTPQLIGNPAILSRGVILLGDVAR